MPASTLQYRLDASQIRHFEEEGYLILDHLFTDHELQPVIDEIIADLDQRCRDAVAAGTLSRTYEEYDFEHRLTHVNAENVNISKSMWDMKLVLPSFFYLMTNPKLLDVAEQFCGPEIIASSVYRLRPKVPTHSWSPVPWHQDSAYFEPYCDLGLVVTVWVPLVDATEERGCLWVMPRMHKGGLFFHQPDDMGHYLVIPDEEFGGHQAVAAPVPKGGVLLLNNRTPHASFENKSDVVRWSMDLRYQSAALPTNAAITRLPGEAKSSATVGVPLACNPPEPDFLIRSQLRPQEVMKTAEEFIALRKNHTYQAATDRWGYSVAKRKDPLGNPYKTGGSGSS
jgi:ectoine hydroxylase-related dioxygenase (phytanoyl-CoA dioxygenase family)